MVTYNEWRFYSSPPTGLGVPTTNKPLTSFRIKILYSRTINENCGELFFIALFVASKEEDEYFVALSFTHC